VTTWHEDDRDKYGHPATAEVDCEARVARCRAVCCAFAAPLTRQDVAEGVAEWDPARPYWLARGADGWCVHRDPAAGGCRIHDRRPLACRTYSCAGDPDIWRDFAAGVPDPDGIERLLARCSARHPQRDDG